MARAMRAAVEAGYAASRAGRIPERSARAGLDAGVEGVPELS